MEGEFHLLRLLGRHRNSFDLKICPALGYNGKRIEWLDYKYDSKQFIPDKEYIGIHFLENTVEYKTIKGFFGKSIGHLQKMLKIGMLFAK